MDETLRLYLPFDDPDGAKAYDYSGGRNDAVLSDGAKFSKKAKEGKSLELNGGECITSQQIPFDSDFTLMAHVMISGNRLGWLVNGEGLENFAEGWLEVIPNHWHHIAFVNNEGIITVYLDNREVDSASFEEQTPIGLALSTEEIGTTTANVDDVRLYDRVLSLSEMLKLQAAKDVEYFIDGVNFKDYGVYVSASENLVGRLAQKEAATAEYDNYHGVVRARNRKRFKERVITLNCFIEASSRSAFVEWAQMFLALFDGDGTHRLKVNYDGGVKGLVYEVQTIDEVVIDKKWGKYNDELMVGTFQLQLTEDEPVKRVLRHISINPDSEVTITLTSYKHLNIYWGDGTATYRVSGSNRQISHTYTQPGEYDIIVAGVIEDIEAFDTNAIVLWPMLK